MNNDLNVDFKVSNFLMYVTEPDKIFEQEVEEKYQKIIVPMFETKSLNVKKIIYDNILVLSKLISKINH